MYEEKMYDLLLRSLDATLLPEETTMLEEALRSSPELRTEKERLLEMRSSISAKHYSFKPNFSSRVMDRLEAEKHPVVPLTPVSDNSLYKVFVRVAMTAAAAIIILILSIYFTEGKVDMNSLTGIENFSNSDENLVSYLLYEDFNK